jgi:predicted nucleic acid-binding protein
VALKWVLSEPDSAKALRIRDDARNGSCELIAPDFFPVELGHSLARAERQGRVSVNDGWAWWQLVMADAPTLHPHIPLMPRGYAIASAVRMGVYDCLYAALAEFEGCEFITADDRLVRNLQTRFPFIVSLASLP